MGDMDVNNIHASSADFSVDMGSLKIADSSIKNIGQEYGRVDG